MKTLKLALIVAAFAFSVVACNNAPNSNQATDTATPSSPAPSTTVSANANAAHVADDLTSARANYAQHCAVCHGDKGDGGIVKVEGLKLKVPSLKEGHALRHTDEQLTKRINNGGDGMPAFKDKLKPEEIADIVRFIHQEFQSGVPKEAATAAPKS